jgi:aerobic carbon-monoxide dehydrogenase small subunit
MWVNLIINGKPVESAIHPGATLLEFLREELRLTGCKEGCGKGECGACTVILNGELVDSCLLLAAQADGCNLVTVEGLATAGPGGGMHAVQRTFVAEGGVQCGFCTPGLVVSAAHLVDTCAARGTLPTKEEIHETLEGNLCRCTGYTKVINAIERAAKDELARAAAEQVK